MPGRLMRTLVPLAVVALLGVGAAVAASGSNRASHGTVQARKTAAFGTVLFAANGRVLYRFTHDRRRVDTCSSNATCSKYWPPLTVASGKRPTAGAGVSAKLLGTIKLANGKTQVTYAGFPLYFFFKDKDSGDQYGQGFDSTWYVVNAKGALVRKKAAVAAATTTTSTTSTPTTTSAGGGYGGGYGSGYGG